MKNIFVPTGVLSKLSKKTLEEIQQVLNESESYVKCTDVYGYSNSYNTRGKYFGDTLYQMNKGFQLVESDMIEIKDKELDELRKKVRELEDLKRSISTIKKSLGDV